MSNEQKQYKLDDVKVKENEQYGLNWKNLQSCEILITMLKEVTVKVKDIEAVLRAVDFIGGVHTELRNMLIKDGVLQEMEVETPKQSFTEKLKEKVSASGLQK